MRTRRELLRRISAFSLAAAAPALAQRHDRLAIIALFSEASPQNQRQAPLWKIFRERLRELGHVEGKTYSIESRWSSGQPERRAALAAELVSLNPDVIVAATTAQALAASQATAAIPIVAIGPTDPVKLGLVQSLARPGGNVTGLSVLSAEYAGKMLQFLLQIRPGARSVGYLTDPTNQTGMQVFGELQERGRGLGIVLQLLDGRTRDSVQQAFEIVVRERIDGLVVSLNPLVLVHGTQIVEAAARLRVPTVYQRGEYVALGGLLSYGIDPQWLYSRAADYVHRILNGTKPSELPFELPLTLRLVVNMKTARALGLRIPPHVRASADEIIE
jgi:putative ABC transport system substrate-binding protein